MAIFDSYAFRSSLSGHLARFWTFPHFAVSCGPGRVRVKAVRPGGESSRVRVPPWARMISRARLRPNCLIFSGKIDVLSAVIPKLMEDLERLFSNLSLYF